MQSFYKIGALTDMHVGSGDANYNIVENQVQRDTISGFPTINASSLKGALRSHFGVEKYPDVFGSSDKPGEYKFFSAKLLSYPVRSNKKPFYRATCPAIIKEFSEWLKTFNLEYEDVPTKFLDKAYKALASCEDPIFFDDEDVIIEDYIVRPNKNFMEYKKKLEDLFGENLVIFPDDNFKQIVCELPIIARNNLENGISKNLWYEEIIPRETKFYLITMVDEGRNADFESGLLSDVIQIGGNATIGYGYTRFERIKVTSSPEKKDGE